MPAVFDPSLEATHTDYEVTCFHMLQNFWVQNDLSDLRSFKLRELSLRNDTVLLGGGKLSVGLAVLALCAE